MLNAARKRGYSVTVDTFTSGLSAMAAIVTAGHRGADRRHHRGRAHRAVHRGADGGPGARAAVGLPADGGGERRGAVLPEVVVEIVT